MNQLNKERNGKCSDCISDHFSMQKTYKHFKLIYLNNVQLLFEVKQLLNHRPVLFWVDHQDSATLFDEVTHLAL